jgi:hypothetical protein
MRAREHVIFIGCSTLSGLVEDTGHFESRHLIQPRQVADIGLLGRF